MHVTFLVQFIILSSATAAAGECWDWIGGSTARALPCAERRQMNGWSFIKNPCCDHNHAMN